MESLNNVVRTRRYARATAAGDAEAIYWALYYVAAVLQGKYTGTPENKLKCCLWGPRQCRGYHRGKEVQPYETNQNLSK